MTQNDPAPEPEPTQDAHPEPPEPEPRPAPQQRWQPPPPRTNGFAIAALVVGITGLFFCFGAIAIVLGNIASRQIETSGERGRGMATAGIVLGILAIVLVIVQCFLVTAFRDSVAFYD